MASTSPTRHFCNSALVTSPDTPAEIAAFITRRDRSFRPIVNEVGPPPLRARPAPVTQRYPDLVRSITSQLLATTAADTIHRRVVETCGGVVSAQSILSAGTQNLRDAGLNRVKAQAMVDLAQDVLNERIRLAAHGRMSDEQIVADVASVRGIGPWTAHMYLIFTMGRRDVWPTGDFAVRSGWSLVHHLDEALSERQMKIEGDRFAGVRTAVAWYCWQAVHLHRQAK